MRTAIVLAGGRSARFGGDKLGQRLDGEAMLDRAIHAVSEVADEVLVMGRTIERPTGAVRAIPDPEPFGGPLVALVTALDAARGQVALVAGGDMPRLVPAVLRAMLDRIEADPAIEAVILAAPEAAIGTNPHEPQRRHVLPLAVRVQPAARAAREAVEAGRRSLQALLDRMAVVELSQSAWRPLDPEATTLLDVDTRADFERIRAG